MGNTESNVTSGVKKQAGTSTQKLYKFVDVKGEYEHLKYFPIDPKIRVLSWIDVMIYTSS